MMLSTFLLLLFCVMPLLSASAVSFWCLRVLVKVAANHFDTIMLVVSAL